VTKVIAKLEMVSSHGPTGGVLEVDFPVHHLDSSDPPGKKNTGDQSSEAGKLHNGMMLTEIIATSCCLTISHITLVYKF